MTTPQDPSSPQDDPQNPYGGPPPPPAQPPYGAQPGYGPAAQPGAQPGAGAQPGYPAYGQQPYGQPGYPTYPGGAPDNDAPKGLAITSLILSFLGCTGILAIVSIVMAVIVLLRGKDGRNHGKGLAIAAIIISIITLAIGGAILALGVFVSSLTDVEDLSSGDCITASGLSDDSSDTVTNIETVTCAEAHDGEVLATADLTAAQAKEFNDSSVTVCGDAIVAAGKADLIVDPITFTALTGPDPGAGDKVACIAYSSDGAELTGSLS